MTAEDKVNGWWDAPAGDKWVCPECKKESDPTDWAKTQVACEDCEYHDGRVCPLCEKALDHVWGAQRMFKATVGRDHNT